MDAARILKTVRARAGLTLRELAKRAGTSDATLSAYESGRVQPRLSTLSRIVEAAGWRLSADLTSAPVRDARRASAGEELWQVMELAQALPQRTRDERARTAHAVFGRA